MGKIIRLEGKKFGRLIVRSLDKSKGNSGQFKWNCICDCGNKHLVTGESLRSGKSKSCGCLLKEARYVKNKNCDRQKAMLLLIYSPMKKRHRKRFKDEKYINFNIFKRLSLSDCFYCGSKPSNTQPDVRYEHSRKIKITSFILKHNGIDRIDSNKGYIDNNVLPCCKKCNTAKNTLTQKEFKNHVRKIYRHLCL